MIPKIQREVLSPIIDEINEDTDKLWNRIVVEQPILAEYLTLMLPRVRGEAILMALTIFRMIEAQIEVEELENMFE